MQPKAFPRLKTPCLFFRCLNDKIFAANSISPAAKTKFPWQKKLRQRQIISFAANIKFSRQTTNRRGKQHLICGSDEFAAIKK
jgi:hypothetical protein